MYKMIIGITGHRPDKLWGYGPSASANEEKLEQYLKDTLVRYGAKEAVTGMALGVDMIFDRAVLSLKDEGYDIKLISAVPCRNQTAKWFNQKNIDEYNYILSQADRVVLVSDCEYNSSVMQIRNEWIVDNVDLLLAVWNGSNGGTGNCIRYAKAKNKAIMIIPPWIFNNDNR